MEKQFQAHNEKISLGFTKMDPCLPLPLQNNVLEELTAKAKDWALMHALGMRVPGSPNPDLLTFAAFVLLPSTFPKKEFIKAKQVQLVFNEVLHKAAHDYEFLKATLASTIEVDEFTRRLFKLYETVRREGIIQPLSLAIIRSDYLLHANGMSHDDVRLQQVETNTIASSFGALTTQMFCFHRYILQELGFEHIEEKIPQNQALQGLCNGLIAAWKLYKSPKAVIMFVVEDVTINICDQRMMEFEIRRLDNNVTIIRRTFREIAEDGTLKDKRLYVNGFEVAVVYYRTGYVPADYHSDKDWNVRLMIEMSRAIKCPTINYHLVGTKKVQQELARSGMLERFLKDSSKVNIARDVFTGLYALDMNEEGDRIVRRAIENPVSFVLKPQREGGGNNFYGDDVRKILTQLKGNKERTAYILMDRICPPAVRNYVVRPGRDPELLDVVSELGIFGVVIGTESEIMVNQEVGHLLRTKSMTVDEGGVSAGFAALDSVFLH